MEIVTQLDQQSIEDDVQELAEELPTEVPPAVPEMKRETPKKPFHKKASVDQHFFEERLQKPDKNSAMVVAPAVSETQRKMPGIFARIKNWFLFRQKANLDYQAARGTQHRKLIEGCLPNLKKQIGRIRSEAVKFEKQLSKLDKESQNRLSQMLKDHLVSSKLVEVSGVGPKIASKIHKRVYKGNLTDLHRASNTIRGIGQSKQANISAWVRRMGNQFNQLLKQNFPGKEKYLEEARSKQRVLEINLETAKEDLKTAQELKLVVDRVLTDLNAVSPKDYFKSLRGESSEATSEYSLGVFAPWESPPSWFKTLLNEYGE